MKNLSKSLSLTIADKPYRCIDLPSICGDKLGELPHVLKLLLENVVRQSVGAERDAAVQAILDWTNTGASQAEIGFVPNRILMHDTTSTPALVDIAGMRNTLAENGVDPSLLNPSIPIDISVDHSLAVEVYGKPDALAQNMAHEIRRNRERYAFMRWSAQNLAGVRIHPPGTGIMHTFNLEQLSTVVTPTQIDGTDWLIPDVMLGTDSHTPMVNGIGVLGWGVGGLEAQTVMFGMPTMLRVPDVVGVKLVGRMNSGSQATDLALVVTHRLRQLGMDSEFVEFYGSGVSTLSADDRAVVANMAPEFGGTTGFFAVDEETLAYLKRTGRSVAHCELVERYCKAVGLWFDPDARPRFTKSITIDLSEVGIHVAGPKRPQDLLELTQVPSSLTANTKHPVAFAAITSCTNTSNPKLLIAAGLLARKARQLGLSVPTWVKTSLAPGSPAAAEYLTKAGLMQDLEALGFGIVGYGCTTCIGNPGPLPELIAQSQAAGKLKAVAILSGNRNFPGRVHPDIELSFIMSPALVVAYALAGDAQFDWAQPLIGSQGRKVYLQDLMPPAEDIESATRMVLGTGDSPLDFQKPFIAAAQNPMWHAIDVANDETNPHLFPWNPNSNILRRPPFASLDPVHAGSTLGHYTAHPLMLLGDDVTTDHLSPASAIPPQGLVADYLAARGEDRRDLNVFASRRGNWEVMMRGAFHSKTLKNDLHPDLPLSHTLHVPSNTVMPIWEAAQQYRDAGLSVVVVAGERYGMGSSRDWAAKGQRVLGIRAVLAVSFERIHRSNLIGMGVLPLLLPEGVNPQTLGLKAGDTLAIDADAELLAPNSSILVTVQRKSGETQTLQATAVVQTQLEVQLLRNGGVMPTILKQYLDASISHSREGGNP